MAGIKRAYSIILALSLILVALLTVLWVCKVSSSEGTDIGSRCVMLMYDFSTPQELATNQKLLQNITTDQVFETLTIDNTNRAVNAYFKFQYSPSVVNILASTPGCVLYTITNDYVDPDAVWVFLYTLDTSGAISGVTEYQVLARLSGGEGSPDG